MSAQLAKEFVEKLGDNLSRDLRPNSKDLNRLSTLIQSLTPKINFGDPKETRLIIQSAEELYQMFFLMPPATQAELFEETQSFPVRLLSHVNTPNLYLPLIKRLLVTTLKAGTNAPTKEKRDFNAKVYPTLSQSGGHLYDPNHNLVYLTKAKETHDPILFQEN